MQLQAKYQKKQSQLQQMMTDSKAFDPSSASKPPPPSRKNLKQNRVTPVKDLSQIKSLLQRADTLQSKMRIYINDLKDSRMAQQREDHYAEQLMQLSAAQNLRDDDFEIKDEPLIYYQTEVCPSQQ